MKHRSLKSLFAVATVAALAPKALAQLDPAYVNPEPLYLTTTRLGEVQLFDGDKIVYNNAEYVVKAGQLVPVQPGSGAVPMGAVVSKGGQSGKLHKRFISVGYYPLVVFSTGGTLINSSHALVGGTFTDNGSVIAANATLGLNGHQTFELGGFYFTPYGGGDNLYQLDAKYMFSPIYGVQLGYINSSNVNAESLSYFLVARAQGSFANARKSALGLEFGVGAINNLTDQFSFSNSEFFSRNTVNFSTFVTLSYDLGKNLKLLASDWYIRDRDDDITRLGLGLSISF